MGPGADAGSDKTACVTLLAPFLHAQWHNFRQSNGCLRVLPRQACLPAAARTFARSHTTLPSRVPSCPVLQVAPSLAINYAAYETMRSSWLAAAGRDTPTVSAWAGWFMFRGREAAGRLRLRPNKARPRSLRPRVRSPVDDAVRTLSAVPAPFQWCC